MLDANEPVGGTSTIVVDSGVLYITTSVTTPLFFTELHISPFTVPPNLASTYS